MNYNPYELYKNSYLHYSNIKSIKDLSTSQYKDIIVNLLDKRFLTTTNIDVIQSVFPYCKVKDLDDYYYSIYSLYPLDKSKTFYLLLDKSIIISIEEFIELSEGRRY